MTDTLPITNSWAVDDIIDAHDLDHRRAMAFAAIVSYWTDDPVATEHIHEALYHLRRLRANSGLLLSASSIYPLDPLRARQMTGETVSDNFGIDEPNIVEALRHIIPDGDVMLQSVHGLTDDIDTAIWALEHFLKSGEAPRG
jgi:hypothetical protein